MVKECRTYTPEFKVRVVLELISGKKSTSQASREHGIKDSVLSRWRQEFLERAPQATWGRMLLEATKAVIQYGHWWRVFFPGAMLFFTILSINYIGDGLRDALDPMDLTSKRN